MYDIEPIFEIDDTVDVNNYLKKCGIDDVALYINPNISCCDNCYDYDNINDAYDTFMRYI